MIKAVFFDVDGTLVSFKTKTMPVSTRRSLDALRERGIMVFVASGRHPSDIVSVTDFVFDGYVALNGGWCVAGTEEVVFRRDIPAEDIERLIEWQGGSERFACVLAREEGMCLNFVDERVMRIRSMVETGNPARVVPFDEWSAEARGGVLQLIAFFGREDEERLMREVLPGCAVMRWNPLFADVVPAGVNKAEGIGYLLARFGLSKEEVMAFGDGGNDIPMLEHVGMGVAMGNAEEAVKRSANYVTTSVDDRGVERALLHFGLIG